jgi:hypothetical protein
MVRAASTGAFDYTGADPYNSQWRLRHILIIRDLVRQEDCKVFAALHNHWLAYVAHSRLEDDSWRKVKENAANALTQFRDAIFPWDAAEKSNNENATIDNKYADLIAQYRQMIASKAVENTAGEERP